MLAISIMFLGFDVLAAVLIRFDVAIARDTRRLFFQWLVACGLVMGVFSMFPATLPATIATIGTAVRYNVKIVSHVFRVLTLSHRESPPPYPASPDELAPVVSPAYHTRVHDAHQHTLDTTVNFFPVLLAPEPSDAHHTSDNEYLSRWLALRAECPEGPDNSDPNATASNKARITQVYRAARNKVKSVALLTRARTSFPRPGSFERALARHDSSGSSDTASSPIQSPHPACPSTPSLYRLDSNSEVSPPSTTTDEEGIVMMRKKGKQWTRLKERMGNLKGTMRTRK